MSAAPDGPAYYAAPRLLHDRRAREWWTVLHPPYTAWHLACAALGAALAPTFMVSRLWVTLLAFFCAVGLGAHALDELHGRPLGTAIAARALVAVAAVGIAVAVALGVLGVVRVSGYLALFIAAGLVLVLAYNLELFAGRLHRDAVFALGWGGFPTVVAGFAQSGRLTVPIVLGGAATTLLARAQRQLSTPARTLRRRTAAIAGEITDGAGAVSPLTRTALLAPLEGALRTLSWTVCVGAVAAVGFRLGW